MYAAKMKLAMMLAMLVALGLGAAAQSLQPAPGLTTNQDGQLQPRPSLQPAPGGGAGDEEAPPASDLVLETAVNGRGDPSAAQKAARANDKLTYRVFSPGGTVKHAPFLAVQIARPDASLSPAGGGLASDLGPGSYLVVIAPEPEESFDPARGVGASLQVPAGLAGWKLSMQGYGVSALDPNGMFEATEVHEIHFL